MPSPLDLLEGRGPFDPSPSLASDEALRSVRAEGSRRRTKRRRRIAAIALLGLVLLAVPVATLRSGGEGRPRELNVAADDVGSIPDIVPDVEVPTSLEPVPSEPLIITEPTLPPAVLATPDATVPPITSALATAPPRTAPSTTPTTARVCRDSSQPACGPFRWDPVLAANQPLVASFSSAPTTAVAGQTVTFEVAWSDGDAKLSSDRFSTDGTRIGSSCMLVARYGPWTPPARIGGSGTLSYPTTFAEPGTYEVGVELSTSNPQDLVGEDCAPVYGNGAYLHASITVTPSGS